jgi:hypothetical protein
LIGTGKAFPIGIIVRTGKFFEFNPNYATEKLGSVCEKDCRREIHSPNLPKFTLLEKGYRLLQTHGLC